MANPLARVIMNNITQNSKPIGTKNSPSRSIQSISGLGQKEEQLLLNVMNKNSGKATGASKTFETLNSSSRQAGYNNRVNTFEKVKLEDLVKGNVKPKNGIANNSKSNTMMTLNELASKVKKPNDTQVSNIENSVEQQKTKDVYVKTGVINNLEAYIPKVSLNSIGKKGSLL